MLTPEPAATAVLLATFGALLALSVVASRAIEHFSVPLALLFLCIGMLAGSEGVGGLAFDDYHFAYRAGTVALALILFDGGLNTPIKALRDAAAPAAILATVGVAGIAVVVGFAAHVLGAPWPSGLLLGALVSSTDAAAVFSTLRASGIQLKRRVGATLELESGVNDPMAVILTTELTRNMLEPGPLVLWRVPLDAAVQLAVGLLAGWLLGAAGRALMGRLRLPSSGLYTAFTVAIACLAFGVPTLLYGSGFLAVYVAGVMLGKGPLPFQSGVLRVHDALAWLSQIAMFLLLGLLVFPSDLPGVVWIGLALTAVLAFVARPLVVTLCLLPFRFTGAEVGYMGWVGLRGAVPIILATYPVLAGVPGADRLFDIVFIIVVLSALVPGSTVAFATRRLGLERKEPPSPPAVLAIESRQPLTGELLSFYIDERLAVSGASLDELALPDGAAVTLVIRGNEMIPPRGSTVLTPGDHVYVVSRPEDRAWVQLLLGRPEEP
ncbi:MAG TPA: potassium/proton antiporter [Gemmatimonadales bacterium]|nr:potassium/proton antiporter [Gemmatimonadales bacterium]